MKPIIKIKMFLASDRDSPSCYYRGYEIARILAEQDIDVEVKPSHIPVYPRKKTKLTKLYLYTINFIKRLFEVCRIQKDEIIYVQTAIAFWGSPLLEWLIKKVGQRPLIVDIDDAYFIYKPSGLQRILGPWRTKVLIRLADIVLVGSHFLKEYIQPYNPHTFLVPTSVDMAHYKTPAKTTPTPPVIGWTGNPTGLRYLKILKEPLEILARKYNFEFRIIGANEYESDVPEFQAVQTKLITWTRETEWQEIAQFDIGVMPLYDTEWEKGKCAFKAVQYMTLGIPAVCSAVGENRYLIQDGVNGFLATTASEWINKLESLIRDETLRKNIGSQGRLTAEQNYALADNVKRILDIIRCNIHYA